MGLLVHIQSYNTIKRRIEIKIRQGRYRSSKATKCNLMQTIAAVLEENFGFYRSYLESCER